jgi:hypothetical protein
LLGDGSDPNRPDPRPGFPLNGASYRLGELGSGGFYRRFFDQEAEP